MKFDLTFSSWRFEREPEPIEIDSLKDLERLQKENNGLELIIDFNEAYIEVHLAGE